MSRIVRNIILTQPTKRGLRRLLIVGLALAYCMLAVPTVAYAGLSEEQRRLIGSGVRFFDVNDDSNNCSAPANPQSNSLPANSSVYILGDSITVRTEAKYRQELSEKSITATINASVGRSWTGAGQTGTGNVTAEGSSNPARGAVADDQNVIKDADGIVVALGSNGGEASNPIGEVIDTLRGHNPDAPIWWINTVGTSAWTSADLSYLGPFNASLASNASSKNFTVIDWFKAVSPSGDPAASPAEDTSRLLADGLHPNDTGTTRLSQLVAGIVAGNPVVQGASGGSACCAAGTPLAGTDNPSKVWNYLISKGLTNLQAAGAMGNLQHEGNFNPKIVEGGVWGGQDWPTEMDTIPPPVGPQGQPGYGIVQWTSAGRKQGLQQLADESGRPVYDLGLQLDFMWQELNSDYYKTRALDPLLAATDLGTAVSAWQDHYEVGANFEPRMAAATEWLARMGSGTAAPAPSTVPTASCGEGTTGDLQIETYTPALPTSGGKITPKGITLHWWGSPESSNTTGIESLANTLRGRGLAVQFGVTADGKIYQMTANEDDQAGHAIGGNSTTFGIEIEGTDADFGADGPTRNPAKFEAVVFLVKYLVDKYDISTDSVDVVCNDVVGIHPHKAYNKCGNTKVDIDDAYYNAVMERVRSQ